MEEKLIKGGEMISKASKQEVLLKKAEQELRERQLQEAKLARELAEKEELNVQLEEHFSSLQEEVEVKTKKLKKLWGKYQAATREAQDLQEEFQVRFLKYLYLLLFFDICLHVIVMLFCCVYLQAERTDMLDTIRQLSRNMKLKELIIANFIPEEVAKAIEKRAVWNPEEDTWNLAVSMYIYVIIVLYVIIVYNFDKNSRISYCCITL